MSAPQGSSSEAKNAALKSFLIRIDGGTKFRGKRPYIVTCIDKKLSTELHRTRPVEGGRKVTWNEAFVIDLSEYYVACEREGLAQPENLTFVLLDADDEELTYLGYVPISMYSLRMSQLDHVTEDIRDGKGTLTFSTTPVNEPQSAVRTYAEQVKGYFVKVFEGLTVGKTDEEESESNGDGSRLHKTVDAAKGMTAAAVTSAQLKLSSLRGGAHSEEDDVADKEVKKEESDKFEGSEQKCDGDESGGSVKSDRVHKTVDAAKGMAAAAVSSMQSKFSAMREGAQHVEGTAAGEKAGEGEGGTDEKCGASDKKSDEDGTEDSCRGGGVDGGDKVHKALDAAKGMATKVVTAAQEKLSSKNDGAGAEASGSGEGQSHLGGIKEQVSKMDDKLSKAVKTGKEGIMQSVQHFRKEHGSESKDGKQGS